MNKKTIVTILLALVAMAGQGQEIKRVTATPEDFMEHMAMYGYEVFTYDISSLRDSASGFTIVIREYDHQGMIDTYMSALGFTKTGADGHFSNGEYEVWNVIPRNVLADKDGDLFVVDAEIRKA